MSELKQFKKHELKFYSTNHIIPRDSRLKLGLGLIRYFLPSANQILLLKVLAHLIFDLISDWWRFSPPKFELFEIMFLLQAALSWLT